jgi:hypothetical protein
MFWHNVKEKNVSMAIALYLVYGISYPNTGHGALGGISLTQKLYPPQGRILAEILLNSAR